MQDECSALLPRLRWCAMLQQRISGACHRELHERAAVMASCMPGLAVVRSPHRPSSQRTPRHIASGCSSRLCSVQLSGAAQTEEQASGSRKSETHHPTPIHSGRCAEQNLILI